MSKAKGLLDYIDDDYKNREAAAAAPMFKFKSKYDPKKNIFLWLYRNVPESMTKVARGKALFVSATPEYQPDLDAWVNLIAKGIEKHGGKVGKQINHGSTNSTFGYARSSDSDLLIVDNRTSEEPGNKRYKEDMEEFKRRLVLEPEAIGKCCILFLENTQTSPPVA